MEDEAVQVGAATAELGPTAILLMGLIAAILGILTMWLAALIMHVKDATLGRAVLAAVAMSVLTIGAAGGISRAPEQGVIPIAVAGLILAVMALKYVFRTSVWKAAGVLVLNAMMQVIISSIYVQARMGEILQATPS